MKLFYFTSRKNFGDLLNETMFNTLSNTQVNYASSSKCNVVAIGSLLEKFLVPQYKFWKRLTNTFKPPVLVYGTGFICPPKKYKTLYRKLDVRAVRGYYSLARLKQYKGVKISSKVAIADPGLLVSKFYNTTQIKKKYKLGIIPHYVDQNNSLLDKIKVKNSIVLDICCTPEDFIKQLAECECVISSAMHGLIAADSLRIPNIRMILSDKIYGGDYKFNDYYSAFNIESHLKVDLNHTEFNDSDVEKIKQNYLITDEQVEKLQNDLLNAYPYQEINNAA